MRVLVVGGTGTVGRAVARHLVDRGERVRVMSRTDDADKIRLSVEWMYGDLDKPATLPAAFKAIDAVFLLNAIGPNETAEGLAAIEAAKRAGVRRLVYMSVVMPRGSEIVPHFSSKIPVERAVRESGLEWTILRPNRFFQNDLAMRDVIVRNAVYPQPIGDLGVTRVDVRDVADAAAMALTGQGHTGQVYTLHGPRAWTGEDTARVYSEELGRTVRYAGNDLDAWAEQAGRLRPAWLVEDLRIMYRFLQEHGAQATADELEMERSVLGHDPRAFETFVWEAATEWRVTGVSPHEL